VTDSPTIDKTETVYKGWCRLDRVEVSVRTRDGQPLRLVREVHDHGSAVAVLPYDPDRRTALLVRQLRVPVLLEDGDGHIVEVAAGLLDPDDPHPEAALVREAREELGFGLDDLECVGRTYSSPGSLTETLSLYLGTYSHDNRVGPGGGLIDEGEDIEVLECPLADLAADADRGAVRDMKTLLLIQTLRLKKPHLF